MATSTIPALKAALLTGLQARAALRNVQVTWGLPNQPGREVIALWNTDGEQESASFGQQRRNELYNLTILISVLRSTHENQQEATERAFELAAEIEEELRADATVDGTVVWALVEGPFTLDERIDRGKGEREALITMTVAVKARI